MSDPALRHVRRLMFEIDEVVKDLVSKSESKTDKPYNNRKKLTKRDVVVIRSMKRNGVSQKDIADAFDVNPATVSRIVRGHYFR